MQSFVLVILFGLLGGIAVGLQAPLASLMSQRLGLMESVFIVNLGGASAADVKRTVKSVGNSRKKVEKALKK